MWKVWQLHLHREIDLCMHCLEALGLSYMYLPTLGPVFICDAELDKTEGQR